MGTTNTEEVALRLSAKDAGASANVRRLRGEVKGLTEDTDRASRSTRDLAASYRTAASASSSLDRMVDRSALALGALSAGAVTWGLKSASSFELSRSAFGALLQDVAAGNRLFDQLQAYNKESPLSLQSIAAAEQTLLQFGISGDKALTVLKGLGDVASLTMDPANNLQRMALALGQISSAGVLRAQDLNQLIDSGFPAYRLLAEITGKTAAQLRREMETGLTLPAATYVEWVEKMQGTVLGGFEGGALKASQTLWGTWERFKDQLSIDLAAGLEPILPDLKTQLPALSSALSGMLREVGPQLPALVEATIELTPAVVSLASAMADVATSIAPLVSGAAGKLGPDGLEALLYGYLGWRFVGRPLKNMAGKGSAAPAAAASTTGTLADVAAGSKSVLGRAGMLAKWLGPLEIAALGKMAWRTRPELLGGDAAEQTAGMGGLDRLWWQMGLIDSRVGDGPPASAFRVGPRTAGQGQGAGAPAAAVHIGKVEINNPQSDIDVANALEWYVRKREERR